MVCRLCRLARALLGRLTRLRELLGARAFLQFAKIRFRFTQVRLGGIGGRRLPVCLLLAHQAASHEAQQPVALAHGVVTLHAGGVAARDAGANGRVARAIPEFLDARFGLGELRTGGLDVGGRQRAILHHDDIAGLHRRAFGEWQGNDGFVRIGDQLHAIALERPRQGVFVVAPAGREQDRACESGARAQLHAANSKRMDRSTACTCLVMPPMEM